MIDTDLLFRIADAAEENGEFDLARQSFERGAALGSIECITRLAYLYDVGLGVVIDKSRAMQLYRRAWRSGKSSAAANNIAILYRETGNRPLMFRWYLKAAQIDDGSAQLQLAECYLNGVGVKRDLQAALKCLATALRSQFISDDDKDEARTIMDTLALRIA